MVPFEERLKRYRTMAPRDLRATLADPACPPEDAAAIREELERRREQAAARSRLTAALEGERPTSGHVPTSARPAMVVVGDIDMPFGRMVAFMVKWSLASIPAALILALVVGLVWLLGYMALSIVLDR